MRRSTLFLGLLIGLSTLTLLQSGCTASPTAAPPSTPGSSAPSTAVGPTKASDTTAPGPSEAGATQAPVATTVGGQGGTATKAATPAGGAGSPAEPSKALFLELDAPAEDASVDSPALEVKGRTIAEAVVSVNGDLVEVKPDGSFATGVQLDEGPNDLEVVASDPSGNEQSVVRSLIYEP